MKAFFKSVLSTTIGMLIGGMLTFLFIILLITTIIKTVDVGGGNEPIINNSILHLKMHGELVDKHKPLDFDFMSASAFFQPERTMGLYEINQALDRAKTDSRFQGVFLDIRDFEGGWAAVYALHEHLKEFARSGKWIYAYADHLSEKAYLLATAANQIFMQPSGDIELKGLSVSEAFLKGLFDKLEVQPMIFRVGKFKAAVEPLILEKMSEANREQNQALLNDIWVTSRDEISKVMKIPATRLDEIASRLEVTSAAQAKDAGLIHKLLYADEVEDMLKAKTVGKDKDIQLVTVGRMLHERAFASRKAAGRVGPGKKIAIIFAEGEIKSGQPGRDEITPESIHEDLQDAKDDKDVAAVVVRVNSPGGDAQASDVIWRDLKITDEEMPVVISMGDVAASGGYYMSTAGRYIFAEPTTITGSIGVFGIMFNTEKFFRAKAGVNFDRVVTHPSADIGNSNRPMTAAEASIIQRDVELVYKRFLDVVQEGRGFEKRNELEAIAEGRVWSGLRAKEIGLVDELGGLDSAIKKAAELAGLGKEYEIEVFPGDQDSLSRLLAQFTGSAMSQILDRETLKQVAVMTKYMKQVVPVKSGIQARLPFDLHID